MNSEQILALLTRYATARQGQFRRQDFVTWATHHGLSRRSPVQIVDGAILVAEAAGQIERVPGAEAEVHPLFRAARRLAA